MLSVNSFIGLAIFEGKLTNKIKAIKKQIVPVTTIQNTALSAVVLATSLCVEWLAYSYPLFEISFLE